MNSIVRTIHATSGGRDTLKQLGLWPFANSQVPLLIDQVSFGKDAFVAAEAWQDGAGRRWFYRGDDVFDVRLPDLKSNFPELGASLVISKTHKKHGKFQIRFAVQRLYIQSREVTGQGGGAKNKARVTVGGAKIIII
jgi:hypothetical protein